ncbi:hypothetical protein AYK26_04855 [Euryarchaeota archaeon SM23-78]|nr:MAG: hypothetical protein AYK26_04855 [Euryarchaeota archaeon SM23-78]MBW3000768.1 hypothetical protein [Candidatus Woesearchaeota archaeon]
MILSENKISPDKEIADIVNELEDLQLIPLDEEADERAIELVDSLTRISKDYKDRYMVYLSDTTDCLNGMIQWYNKHKKPVPKNTVYLMLLNDI